MSNATNLPKPQKWQSAICLFVSVTLVVTSSFILRIYETRFHGQPIIPLTEFALRQLPYIILVFSVCNLASSFLTRGRFNLEILFICLISLGCGLYLIGIALPFISYSIGL